jgi:hypothetical protein
MITKTMTGVAIALAALLASPAAFAQGGHQDGRAAFAQHHRDALRSHAQQHRALRPQHAPRRSWGVHNDQGDHVGTDPDPNVRDMIRRDPEDEGEGW